jgi:DNA-binding transcriptional ArsR family regulator
MGLGKKKVSADLSAFRDARILELLAKGLTHQQIAQDLGIDRSSVTKRLSKIGRAAAAQREDLKDQLLISQVEQLQYIISQAMDGWRRSREPLRRVSRMELIGLVRKPKPVEKKDGDAEQPDAKQEAPAGMQARPRENITTSVEERAGNVAYLETAMGAMDRLRKLFGLDLPPAAPELPDELSRYAGLPDRELKRRILDLMNNQFGNLVPPELRDELGGAQASRPMLTDNQLEDL